MQVIKLVFLNLGFQRRGLMNKLLHHHLRPAIKGS